MTPQLTDSQPQAAMHLLNRGHNEALLSSTHSSKQALKAHIKERFLKNLEGALPRQPLKEVLGAGEFLSRLQSMNDVVVSLATGSWRESAILKLASVGIDYGSIPLASADDHYSRIEIMKMATKRASSTQYPCTYFGDGVWDKEACNHLGYNFVLVGSKFVHDPSIMNFQPVLAEVCSITLSCRLPKLPSSGDICTMCCISFSAPLPCVKHRHWTRKPMRATRS